MFAQMNGVYDDDVFGTVVVAAVFLSSTFAHTLDDDFV